MSNRVFEGENSFEVSNRGCSVDFDVNSDSSLTIRYDEEAGWDSQRTYFSLTEQEATMLKEFLIRKGY